MKFHIYVRLLYTKISYLRKNTHLRKDAAFLDFPLKESSKNMIFPWNRNIRKLTKICSFLPFSLIFVRRKIIFSSSVDEKVGMEFTSCSPYQGHNLRWKLLNLWSDYSRGENNESSVCKTNRTWSHYNY